MRYDIHLNMCIGRCPMDQKYNINYGKCEYESSWIKSRLWMVVIMIIVSAIIFAISVFLTIK